MGNLGDTGMPITIMVKWIRMGNSIVKSVNDIKCGLVGE